MAGRLIIESVYIFIMALHAKTIVPLPHHQQKDVCLNRARYRQGRKETAVKVYTIHQESQYLLIHNVPAIGLQDELERMCKGYGEILALHPLPEYPSEDFAQVYLVSYAKLQSARVAKRRLDNRTWYGSPLHVCYAPEFESLAETRFKLQQRYMHVVHGFNSVEPEKYRRVEQHFQSGSSQEESEVQPSCSSSGPITYIWAGKECVVSQPEVNPVEPTAVQTDATNSAFIPRQLINPKRKHDVKPSENQNVQPVPKNIESKLAKISVPNLDVNFKRRKTKA
ncbi:RNA-binding protein 48 [Chamberlinius hualienensis]